jgi:hypothetical protein
VVANLTVAQPLTTPVIGSGTVTFSPTNYNVGDPVTLTATPARWYTFLRWSDGVTNNPRTIAIGASNAYTAVFTNTVPLETVAVQAWDRSFGGNGREELHCIIQTSDGGFMAGGWSASGMTGNKTSPSLGGDDFWVVHMDAGGSIPMAEAAATVCSSSCKRPIRVSCCSENLPPLQALVKPGTLMAVWITGSCASMAMGIVCGTRPMAAPATIFAMARVYPPMARC